MRKPLLLILGLLALPTLTKAEIVEIYRDLPDPHQGEYRQNVFSIDSERLKALPRQPRHEIDMDYAEATAIAVKAALASTPNLGKYNVSKINLLQYEPDLAAYDSLIRHFYRVRVHVLRDDKSDDRTVSCLICDYLVFPDGSTVEGHSVADNTAKN